MPDAQFSFILNLDEVKNFLHDVKHQTSDESSLYVFENPK